ncbi:HugZ family protein [Aurantimonas marianensis]|uniref:Pyridoxamine 5'-phosphate oxidase family protein n=1 Tax=Aurantimonas marianensis TaxID=2920428 RepID=A0A9X2KEY4_9HYPH|nr:pyridoxamine 5'-phosphate oxidase family protein [Aurantimonas marianensis]MCP3055898.1 pyridoxamine 5'-phosphate oxidase family protein [Aurantimonas marianensis]
MSENNDSSEGRFGRTADSPTVMQNVDAAARELARTLLRSARHGALAVLRPGDGHPAASRVIVTTDFLGRPLLLMSDLTLHARALAADPRCSLLVGAPGKGDPLTHPRLTVFGTASAIAADDPERPALRERFLARHPKSALYADFGDFRFVRLEPQSASLNGGFGRAFELMPDDFIDRPAGELETTAMRARDHINAEHRDAVDRIAAKTGYEGRGWRIATLDRLGFEISRGDALRRVEFRADAVAGGGFRSAFVDLAEGKR